jgi:ankyrin repeat protein
MVDSRGYTALPYAAWAKHADCLRLLLDEERDIPRTHGRFTLDSETVARFLHDPASIARLSHDDTGHAFASFVPFDPLRHDVSHGA